MIINPAASLAETPAAPEYFTGKVRIQPVIEGAAPSRMRSFIVDFAPGARTGWHTHPAGQMLHVLSGSGLVQVWDGPVKRINPGDSVWFEPGEKHWHGAAPDSPMSHLAVQEIHDGRAVDWLELVSDSDYAAAPV